MKKANISKQIKNAKKSLKQWPIWMRRIAIFLGVNEGILR